MTERLNQLLHAEADQLDIPPVAADAALTRGRGLRRRRQAGTFVVAAGLAVILGTGGFVAYDRLTDDPELQLSDAAAFEQHGVYLADGKLHVGNHAVEIDAKINAVYYTSAGVVVRTGPTGDRESSDGGYLSLVRPDGTVTPLTPRFNDVEPGTTPSSSLIAFARPSGSGFEAVVWDVATDQQVAAVPFDGAFTWGGWAAPPVSISGDHVYASLDQHTLDINWRTGASEPLAGSPGSRWETVAGDVWADEQSGQVVVRTLDDSSPLLPVPVDGDYAESWLSPDGGYVVVQAEDVEPMGDYPAASLHDIATGESRELPEDGWNAGWTPDGHVLLLSGNDVLSCTAIAQDCITIGEVEDPGSVRLAEAYYGS
jgi:hypothetical protein